MSYDAAMKKLAEVIVGVGGQASIDFSTIDGRFRQLRLDCQLRGTDAAQQNVRLRFNGDSGANYDWAFIRNVTNAASAQVNTAQTYAAINETASSSDGAGVASMCLVEIANYAGTTFHKQCMSQSMRPFSTGPISALYAGVWHSTAAITQITLSLDAGSFVQGSVASLYGIL